MSDARDPSAARPVIMAVVGESNELVRIEQELQKRYGADYRVVCEGSGEAALELLEALKAAGEGVAVVLADQQVQGMSGTKLARGGAAARTS